MNQKVIGEFIAALRKSRGMTQQNLADLLFVSNKSVSKWERGEGLPELSTLVAIADVFDVTLDELVNGSRSEAISIPKSKKHIKYLVSKQKKKYQLYCLLSQFILLLGYILLLTIGYTTFRSTLASGIAFSIYLIALAMQIIIFSQHNFELDDVMDADEIQELKLYRLKYLYRTVMLGATMLILSLPIMTTGKAYSIIPFSVYINDLTITLIILMYLYVISWFIFQHLLNKKGYVKRLERKHYLLGIGLLILVTLPLPINKLFPTYYYNGQLRTITFSQPSESYAEALKWWDFYNYYYKSKNYNIVHLDGVKYYQFGPEATLLAVKDGKYYLDIFKRMVSFSHTYYSGKIDVTYRVLSRRPFNMYYFLTVLSIEAALVASSYGGYTFVKRRLKVNKQVK